MSYRGKPKREYAYRPPHRGTAPHFRNEPFKHKTQWEVDLFRRDPHITKKEEIAPLPETYEEETEKQVEISIEKSGVKAGITPATKNKKKIKFSKEQ